MTILQDWKILIALLVAIKAIFSAKYIYFANVELKQLAKVLPKQIGINEYVIKLVKNKQSSYKLIYNIRSVEFKIFKIYVETNLKNCFVWLLNFLADASILFVYKSNCSFCWYIDYWGLNNLIIKNWYLFFLIDKLLDQSSFAKQFT